MAKIQNKAARKYLEDCGAKLHLNTASHAFYKRGHVIISIPLNADIDYIHLEAIAKDQLGIDWTPADFANLAMVKK